MKSFTQLVGTTSSSGDGSFVDLSGNTSTANVARGKVLINTQHRYYLQKYFDNERTYNTVTIGAQDLFLTATPVVGDTSATLSVAWVPQTCQQLVIFGDSNGEQRTVSFTQGSTGISWSPALNGKRFGTTAVIASGDTSATLSTAWALPTQTSTTTFSDGSTKSVTFTLNSTTITWVGGLNQEVGAYVLTIPSETEISTIGVQFYPIPANVSKIKNDTITIGQLVYTPAPVQSIQEWTMLNALPYTSDIPNYFYIYQNKVGFFPIPSSSGNIISFNYKSRVADMTYADFATGTVAASAGNNAITGTGTTWNTVGTYPLNVDLSYANLMLAITPPKGDGLWYPIQRFTSDSALLLNLPIVNAPVVTGASYTIGQFPLLTEDFQDLLVYSSLAIYYSSVSKDKDKYEMYKEEVEKREKLMDAYLANKSVNVDLGAQVMQQNPNLYLYATS